MSTFREYLEESNPYTGLTKYDGGRRQAQADFGKGALKGLKKPMVVTTHNIGELEDLSDYSEKQFAIYRDEVEKQGGKIELVERRDEEEK